MKRTDKSRHLLAGILTIACFACADPGGLQMVGVPSREVLQAPFGDSDRETFQSLPPVYHPETWFHLIGGNVSKTGITADLEAIAGAGFSGIQLFHGQFGGSWPGVEEQITCLSPLWDDAIRHVGEECRRLGLRFTMQNCPGWAMSGGPWIEPSMAMRHLAWSRTDVVAGSTTVVLPLPDQTDEEWRDYRDIAVLAFPTPQDDTGEPLQPMTIQSNRPEFRWEDCLQGRPEGSLSLPPAPKGEPTWVEVTFPDVVTVRTVEFSNVEGFNHHWCYEPGVVVTIQAVLADGTRQDILRTPMPQSNWQDNRPISLACSEVPGVKTYRILVENRQPMNLRSLRLFSAARKNNWESEAGWTLRSPVRAGEHPDQSRSAFVDPEQIRDLSSAMDEQGILRWEVPEGKWTILRIGHVNTGQRNAPAPPEGTGWECDKLSEAGPDAHFAGYIGRLSEPGGPLSDGLLNGMLMDSWECRTQTWTANMEAEFGRLSGYPLRRWLPAVFGYVVGAQETTFRFLRDWRATINDLFVNRFYGRMARLAKDRGLTVSYETAAGDVFPADILEYYKYADIPMCEFWQPFSDGYVGSLNFKPIKPAASAARLYGKPRVAAEAFTSFALTWDEHFDMLKEVANINIVEGVTHFVFHTYTHHPQTSFLPPGTSFGAGIGTPFLRGQTWWKHMPEFVDYLSRCSFLLERGKPVSDVLWYLGDEISHKPDQQPKFPEGYKYDYCNPDILLTRLDVSKGMLVTPEGLGYRLLWLPDTPRMLPQTLEKLRELVRKGATLVGEAPRGLATLAGGNGAQRRFDKAVQEIWGTNPQPGLRQVGKGVVISGMTLAEALRELQVAPDVTGSGALWTHRKTKGADWYFVSAPKGSGFRGTLDFLSSGNAGLWDPVTGSVLPVEHVRNGERTSVAFDLPKAGSCFVVFRQTGQPRTVGGDVAQNGDPVSIPLTGPWTLTFPPGWGAPDTLLVVDLKAWKDLDLSPEAKAFSGTATYTMTFDAGRVKRGVPCTLDLGRVEMVAVVSLNGKPVRTLWTPPYRADFTGLIEPGENTLTVEVTSTWFNRLVYDAGQPESLRKTWTIKGPSKDAPLRDSGLLGPVVLCIGGGPDVVSL